MRIVTSGIRQWAEDIAQETLLRAWPFPATFEPARGPAWAWPCTVARPPGPAGHTARDRWAGPGTDNRTVVADAIRTLPGTTCALLLETYYRGRTTAKAAQRSASPWAS
ncbi:sigma factor [Streptomyces sp. NPDC054933]